MSGIKSHIQKLDLGKEITLFRIDATQYGQGIFRLVMGDEGTIGTPVTFDGEVYSPWSMKATGYSLKANGTLPRPTLTMANTKNILTGIVLSSNDLKGCEVRRIRTYARFLDDGADPDPSYTLPDDLYIINQKTRHSPLTIQWQLISPLDQETAQLPGRQIVRDSCDLIQRYWDATANGGAGAFNYDNATCPYAETQAYDADGQPCDPEDEVFSKRLTTCCRARFGENAELPFGGFPGVARFDRR